MTVGAGVRLDPRGAGTRVVCSWFSCLAPAAVCWRCAQGRGCDWCTPQPRSKLRGARGGCVARSWTACATSSVRSAPLWARRWGAMLRKSPRALPKPTPPASVHAPFPRPEDACGIHHWRASQVSAATSTNCCQSAGGPIMLRARLVPLSRAARPRRLVQQRPKASARSPRRPSACAIRLFFYPRARPDL